MGGAQRYPLKRLPDTGLSLRLYGRGREKGSFFRLLSPVPWSFRTAQCDPLKNDLA